MKNLLFVLSIAALAAGCDVSPDRRDRMQVRFQQTQYSKAQPVPTFEHSLERDIVIQMYELRNQRVTTHTVWRSDTGVVEGDCLSTGYPIPYDTSLTNPLALSADHRGAVLEQAEPNGIFASKNSNATWILCSVKVDGRYQRVPVYVESKVTAYPYAVTVDYDKNQVRMAKGAKLKITLD